MSAGNAAAGARKELDLIIQAKECLETAIKLYECPNGNCNTIVQAIHWTNTPGACSCPDILSLRATTPGGEPARPSLGPDLIEKIVEEAMLDTWNDICSDTGCHPLDIKRTGRALEFQPAHWSSATAKHVSSRLCDELSYADLRASGGLFPTPGAVAEPEPELFIKGWLTDQYEKGYRCTPNGVIEPHPAPSDGTIRDVVLAQIKRARRAGESEEILAQWICAALAVQSPATGESK